MLGTASRPRIWISSRAAPRYRYRDALLKLVFCVSLAVLIGVILSGIVLLFELRKHSNSPALLFQKRLGLPFGLATPYLISLNFSL